MRNIFLENSYTKWGGETSSRPFSKKTKLSIFLDKQSEHLYSLLSLYVQIVEYQLILKLRRWPLAFTLYKAFLKNNEKPETILPASFPA